MSRGLLLIVLFLVAEPSLCQSSCRDLDPQTPESEESPRLRNPSPNFLKRFSDIDYDSFVGLMGRRSSDTDDAPRPQKRDMHDIFVGLMGRRSSDRQPWAVPGERSTPRPEEASSLTNAS
ncbi:tachykinin-3a isoform X2 [Denticeps clupeoides]|uniref:tachykinin-3a isoform X2 n=1 Tax=Denticeps clupeoides TaxID=299321 RepID=UPI0010A4A99F|nr:tachykinin-3 isoform X2 [Denticeps clupeoides]